MRTTWIRDGKVVIVGIDPGGTTGIAIYHGDWLWNGNSWEYANENIVGLQRSGDTHHFDLYNILCLQLNQNMMVVCESFQNRGMEKDLQALELIGIVKMFAQEANVMKGIKRPLIHFQTASEGKAFWTDEKLKHLGYYLPGQRHSNDAKKHLLHYLTFDLERNDFLLRLKGNL